MDLIKTAFMELFAYSKAALIIERNRTAKLAQEIEQFSEKYVDTKELMK